MDNSKIKKFICCLGTILIIFSMSDKNIDKQENNKIEIEEYDTTYSYKRGNIYFCSSDMEIEKISKTCDETDIIVFDESNDIDPNMKIINSYKIKDPNEMIEILEIIQTYCSSHNTEWNRSVESMYNEWQIHNICSNLNIKTKRTNDVDLNNKDEEFYKSKIISKILTN